MREQGQEKGVRQGAGLAAIEGEDLRTCAAGVPAAIGAAMALTPRQFEDAKRLLRLLADNVSASVTGV